MTKIIFRFRNSEIGLHLKEYLLDSFRRLEKYDKHINEIRIEFLTGSDGELIISTCIFLNNEIIRSEENLQNTASSVNNLIEKLELKLKEYDKFKDSQHYNSLKGSHRTENT